jgi:3-phenylpropionate/trans-cinnamate dioxygenase ferredoxin subunit
MRKARYAVAKTTEVEPDVGRVVKLGGDGGECTLFTHAGRWYALGSLCPHQNASLDGAEVQSGQVICRRHGYRFDLKTGDCVTLGGYGLPVYTVEIEGDTIFVSVWEYD